MKLNKKRTLLVGFAFMTICTFWQIYNNAVPLMLKQTFDMNEAWAGVIMAADNVLALFMLPLFGALSDKVNSKMGKRTPFILFGTVLSVIAMIALAYLNTPTTLIPFVVCLGILLIALATYRSPAVALMPDVTPKALLSKGNALINLMGTIGGIVALGYIATLSPKGDSTNYLPLFLAVGLTMIIGVLVLKIFVKENKWRKEKEDSEIVVVSEQTDSKKMDPAKLKSLLFLLGAIFLWFFGYNAIISAYSKYALVQWNLDSGAYSYALMVAQATALITYIPIGILATKIGRKKTIFIGIAILTIAFGSAGLFKDFSLLILPIFGLAGIGWATINVNSYPMVVSLSTGSDIGKYTGYYYTASMASQILTPIISGVLLEYVGYWTLFPYGAFFVAISAIALIFAKHGDSKPVKAKSKLEAFDVDD